MNTPESPKDSPEFHEVCTAVVAYLGRYGLKESLKMLVTMFETCIEFERYTQVHALKQRNLEL